MARPTLFTHPKFKRLTKRLGIPAPYVCGLLEFLWRVGYESGRAEIGTAEDVELAADWPGEPGAFVKAATECGFLDASVDAAVDGADVMYSIHDLYSNAPEYVTTRKNRENERNIPKTCDHCGCVYHSTERHSKYCSASCRTLSYKAGKKLTQVDGGLRRLTEVDGPPAPAPAPKGNTRASDEPGPSQTWGSFLAVEWGWRYRGVGHSQRDVPTVSGFFDALIECGHDPRALLAGIRDPKRPKTQPTWEFEKQYAPSKRAGPAKPDKYGWQDYDPTDPNGLGGSNIVEATAEVIQ